ncbi:MAG: hypothetical protein WC370_00950 [Dehalococcoidales bacterium]|jgi:hypothetical protein
MKRYLIEYYSKTRISLNDRKEQQTLINNQWIFNYPYRQDCNLTIIVKDKLVKRDNIFLHTGLRIITDIKTDSESKAREISKENVEQIINLFNFSTLASCNSAILVSIINISNDSSPFTYYPQQFQEQDLLYALVKIDKSEFEIVFESYEKSDNKSRIQRALSWLRKGMGEEDCVYEFISYWNGLEVIKHILSKENNVPNKEWEKIQVIFEKELKMGHFSKMKQEIRNGLLHGYKQLDNEFMEKIKYYVEPAKKTLVFCIGDILSLEKDFILNLFNKTVKNPGNIQSIIQGHYENLPEELDKLIDKYPSFDELLLQKQYSISKEGELTVKTISTHQFDSGYNIRGLIDKVEIWGKKDSGIKSLKLDTIINDK